LQPGLVTNSQTFYAPVASATYSLTPARFTNAQSFFSAAVSATYGLAPSLLTNTQTFFAPTVAIAATILRPSLVTNSQTFYPATVTATKTLAPALLTNASTFFAPTVALESFLITKAQALELYKVWLLQGLGASPLVVSSASRTAGEVTQTVSQSGSTVTISTTAAPSAVVGDPGTMIEELALLHGLGADLVVTASSRVAGAVSQTLATSGTTTTVART
jgi:hypothetical protein